MNAQLLSCRFLSWAPLGIEALRFSPDGRWLAVGRANAECVVYDTRTWRIRLLIPGDSKGSIRSINWILRKEEEELSSRVNAKTLPLPNDDWSRAALQFRLITAGLDGVVIEWDLKTLQKKCSVSSYGGACFSASISPDGEKLAVGCDDGTIRIFSLNGGSVYQDDDAFIIEYNKKLSKYSGRILSVCWHGNSTIFAGTEKSTIIRYNEKTGFADLKMQVDRRAGQKKGKKDDSLDLQQVWCVISLVSRGIVVSGDSTGNVSFWDARTCTLISVFQAHQADVLCLSATKDETCVVSTGVDGKLVLFTLGLEKQQWVISGSRYPHPQDIRAVDVSLAGVLASGGADTALCVFEDFMLSSDFTSIRPFRLSSFMPSHSKFISISHVERLILYQQRSSLEVWYLMDRSERREHTSLEDSLSVDFVVQPLKAANINLKDSAHISCSDIAPDGQLIAASNQSGIRFFGFDLQKLQIGSVAAPALSKYSAYALRFVSNDSLLVSTYEAEEIGSLESGSLSGGLVHGSGTFCVLLYDAWRCKVLRRLIGLESAVLSIVLSPEKARFATIDLKGDVNVYLLEDFKHEVTLPRFSAGEVCVCVAFHPGGEELAVFSSGNLFYTFDLKQHRMTRRISHTQDISKIPSQYLSASDGPIMSSYWVDWQTEEMIGKKHPNILMKITEEGVAVEQSITASVDVPHTSSIICQTPSKLCTIRLGISNQWIDDDEPSEVAVTETMSHWSFHHIKKRKRIGPQALDPSPTSTQDVEDSYEVPPSFLEAIDREQTSVLKLKAKNPSSLLQAYPTASSSLSITHHKVKPSYPHTNRSGSAAFRDSSITPSALSALETRISKSPSSSSFHIQLENSLELEMPLSSHGELETALRLPKSAPYILSDLKGQLISGDRSSLLFFRQSRYVVDSTFKCVLSLCMAPKSFWESVLRSFADFSSSSSPKALGKTVQEVGVGNEEGGGSEEEEKQNGLNRRNKVISQEDSLNFCVNSSLTQVMPTKYRRKYPEEIFFVFTASPDSSASSTPSGFSRKRYGM